MKKICLRIPFPHGTSKTRNHNFKVLSDPSLNNSMQPTDNSPMILEDIMGSVQSPSTPKMFVSWCVAEFDNRSGKFPKVLAFLLFLTEIEVLYYTQWAKIWKKCNLGKTHCLPQRLKSKVFLMSSHLYTHIIHCNISPF